MTTNTLEKVTVHAYDWTVEDKYTEDDRTAIHAWCLDRDSKPYLIRFNNFPVFCHVELPLFVNGIRFNWNENSAATYVSWLSTVLGDNKPERGLFKMSKKIYYFRGENRFPMLLLLFKSIEAMERCENLLRKPHPVRDIGMVMARMWESSISVVRKLLTLKEMRYSQWFTVEARKVDEEICISSLEREYIADWHSITPLKPDETSGWTSHPGVLSFDIECYSNNHKAMPNQLHALHLSYMISLIYQRQGDPSSRKRYGLIVGDCDEVRVDATRPGKKPGTDEPVPGDHDVIITRVNTEIELINKMSELVNQLDPEILIGYNILGFDYPYLDARLKRRLQEWRPMGRLIGKPTVMTSKTWKSGAYGHNSINILKMDGRISLDMLPLIKRDYKFDSYGLDAVSKELLGQHRGKHDVKAEVQFKIYEGLVVSRDRLFTCLDRFQFRVPDVEEPQRASHLKDILKSGIPNALVEVEERFNAINQDQVVEGTIEDIKAAIRQYREAKREMTRVMKYCIEDSELVLDLFESMNIWIGLIELSNIVGVTIMDLFTRGQQVRCLSQIYDLAARRGIVVDGRDNDGIRFSGGYVFEPKPGLYENIICLDFASLYPSIMQAFNICYTTLVPPEYMDQIPDDKCYVFDFDQDEDDEDEDDEDEEDPDEKKRRKEEGRKKNKKAKTKKVHRHYKFVKPEVHKGILPELVRNLVAERRAVRARLDGKKDENGNVILEKEKDPLVRIILDKRQNALKVTANSFFGFLGVQNGGRLPLIEGAMCITAKGRELIGSVNNFLEKEKGGTIVYGDTDSSMVNLHITDPSKCNEIGKKLSEEITNFINHPPLKMEFEKGMRRFLVLKKKMYMYTLTTKEGTEQLDERGQVKVMKKGVAEARRDRCKWFRRVSDRISRCILANKPMAETLNVLIDNIQELLRGKIPIKDLVSIRELGAHYKSNTYFIKVFADYLREQGKIVSPGDRLEFVVVETDNANAKVGTKMRSPEMFYERQGTPQKEKIDYVYYLEHVLMNPIDKMFSVGYNRLLPDMPNVGYKPKGRYHFKPIAEPVKMIIRVLADAGPDEKVTILDRVRKLLEPTTFVAPTPRLQILPEGRAPSLRLVVLE